MFKNKYVSILIVAIVAIIAFIFIINDFYSDNISSKNSNSETISSTTTTTFVGDTLSIEGRGNYTVEIIEDTEFPPPSLDRQIVILATLDDTAKTVVINNIKELTKQLRVSPERVDLWLKLGLHYKIIGDYEGAVEVWNYVAKVGPDSINYIAYRNLGDVYMSFLKNYEAAEVNLRRVIEINPSILDSYKMLFELYYYAYKTDTNLAEQILFEGLENNPGSIDLLITLANYYKEKEDTENTQKYYKQALEEAQRIENTQLIKLLKEELSNL